MEETIIINGVKMTMKEYKAYRKAKEAEKTPKKAIKRQKKIVKEIRLADRKSVV